MKQVHALRTDIYPQPREYQSPREERASDLVAILNSVTVLPDGSASVISQWEANKAYNVTLKSCECPDFRFRHVKCKHILALESMAKQ